MKLDRAMRSTDARRSWWWCGSRSCRSSECRSTRREPKAG